MVTKKRVTIGEVTETTPFAHQPSSSTLGDGDEVVDLLDGTEHFQDLKRDSVRRESMAADRLSVRLLEIDDDDSEAEERILRESLDLSVPLHGKRMSLQAMESIPDMTEETKKAAWERLLSMACLSLLSFALIAVALYVGVEFIGPPNQPAGPYRLVERQVSTFGSLISAVIIIVIYTQLQLQNTFKGGQ
jgi:hypothetical protein